MTYFGFGTVPSSVGLRLRCAPRGLMWIIVWLLGLVSVAVIAVVVVAARPVSQRPTSPGAGGFGPPVAAWGSVSGALGRDIAAYWVAPAGSALLARSPGQDLRAVFSGSGVTIRSGHASLGIRLRGYGYGNVLAAPALAAPSASRNRVVYQHATVSEWYANGPLGLEQGFVIQRRPAAHRGGLLTVAIALSGNVRGVLSRNRTAVKFTYRRDSLSYRGLVASDARGRALPAHLELQGRELLLRVDDKAARYPLRIDPFVAPAELTASDGSAMSLLGYSMASDGNTIVVGAPAFWYGDLGAVYVFEEPQHGWANATETAKLTASDEAGGDALGSSVAISGDTIVAGAGQATVSGNSYQGAVYIFVKPKGGWHNETEAAKLTASDGAQGDDLGGSVAISGDTVAAGAEFATVDDNEAQGAVYVFVKPKGGWHDETEAAKPTASDGAAYDNLGASVAASDDRIVAGASSAGIGGTTAQGAAYVFVKPKGGWRSEPQAAKLTATDGAAYDNLGASVATSGDTIMVGAPASTADHAGGAYLYIKPKGGWRNATQLAKLTGSDAGPADGFGASVAIGRDVVVSGAPFVTINGNADQGAVYVFQEPKGGWRDAAESAKLTSSSATAGDLGLSTAIARDGIAAGAPFAEYAGNPDQGIAYVFRARVR